MFTSRERPRCTRMNSTTPLLTLVLAAALALGHSTPAHAVSGVAVDATAVEIMPGLTLREALDTPLSDLDAAAGRELSRREVRAVKRVKRNARRAAVVVDGGRADGLAIAALSTGAGGVLLLLLGGGILGLLACATGIVLGAIALKRIREGASGSRGMALAGFISGIAGAGLVVLSLLLGGLG